MITSGQWILIKGCIAFLSPLVVTNGFVRLWPHLIHVFLGSTWVNSQTASWLVELSLHTPQQRLAMLFSGADNPKHCCFPWESGLLSNTLFFGPTWVSSKQQVDLFNCFCRAHRHNQQQTDRQTHIPCYSVCSDSPHFMHCMQYGLTIVIIIIIIIVVIMDFISCRHMQQSHTNTIT